MTTQELPPLHERDFASRCRIAHALVVGDQMTENDVADLLHVRFYDVPDLVLKGAEMLRFRAEEAKRPFVKLEVEPREPRQWTPKELAQIEKNRVAARAALLKKIAGES